MRIRPRPGTSASPDSSTPSTPPNRTSSTRRTRLLVQILRSDSCDLEVPLSYGEDDDAAFEGAYDQWRTNCLPGTVIQQLRTAADYDELGGVVDEETVAENVRVAGTLDDHLEWFERDLDLDVDGIYLHTVSANQRTFIDDFGQNTSHPLESHQTH